MLSVITFMAIAFLVLSRGERTSVGTSTDQSIARLGADNALERAQVELIAPMLASSNFNSGGLLVSTNFINANGFKTGVSNPTNVAYAYSTGLRLNQADALQNLTNLLLNPRAPVFIVTNRLTGSNDFRYYLDLNRNGAFEPTGWIFVTNYGGQRIQLQTNGFAQDYVQGDPQWIGGLEFPDRNHSADNRFLYRYAYLAVPISQGLDINYIHNAARNPTKANIDTTGGDFFRNQGVGTWEINLASFLYDLNTNIYAWGGPYTYQPGTFVGGNAFVDATSILTNRYGGWLNYQSRLSSVKNLYFNGPLAFANHSIDAYTAGPLMFTAASLYNDPDLNPTPRAVYPWPGADNTNHLFSTQDLFDPTKTSLNFATRLQAAGTNIDTYDRYTFYRLLSQLGTDSAPDPPTKLNLNYDNKVQTNSRGIVSATNFFAWQPVDFFTNAANMLLTNAGLKLSVTNLQVYPTNFYTPSVHRLLQLAANIYDASTNRALIAGQTNGFPSVFRPIFRRLVGPTNNIIVIAGYREVLNADFAFANLAPQMIDPQVPSPFWRWTDFPVYGTPFAPARIASGGEKLEPMVAGVPLIIGAKKGYPNFNELAMETQVFVSRLLEFRRPQGGDPNQNAVNETNQMYVIGITNLFGLEAWNSYSNPYPRNLQLVASVSTASVLTNELSSVVPIYSNRIFFTRSMNIPAGTWKGWTVPNTVPSSMVLPFGTTNYNFLNNATYLRGANPPFLPLTHIFDRRRQPLLPPHWWLNLNTKLQYILVDTTVNRIVDFVNLNNWERTVDITYQLALNNTGPVNPADYRNPSNQWLTNQIGGVNGPSMGVYNQIQVGLNGFNGAPDWLNFSQDPYSGLDSNKAVDGFRYNLMGLSPLYSPGETFFKSNVFYAPFDPVRTVYVHTSWQANDPLVHYTIGDLIDSITFDDTNRVNIIPMGVQNIGQMNTRYRPWPGNPNNTDPLTDSQIALKDPLVTRSDDWDFPTNKYPNIGWLGRVHRGTPWQTVFLKSTNIMQSVPGPQGYGQSLRNWAIWTGNNALIQTPALTNMVDSSLLGTNSTILYADRFGIPTVTDASFTSPTNDWNILDLFTTAFNDNSTRGQLSVNQTNLAAWSAVLGGVSVLPNLRDTNQAVFILPAGRDPLQLVARIVNGINNTRTNFPNNAFPRLGDILYTPELTMASPYIVSTNRAQTFNDEVVERIPQQILGLLHGSEQPPRFVIYSWGQALKPAPKSLYTFSGPYLGLCTNYQITAEVATRAVVHIEGAPTKPRTVIESFSVLPPD